MFKEFSEDSRSEEFLNEFRQKMADQAASNIEERRNEMRKSRSVFVGTLLGLFLAGIVGGFILAPHYNKNYPHNVPVIKNSTDPVKTSPKDRGGMEVENQDKTIYEILDNNQDTSENVENILPAPESPKMPESNITEEKPVDIEGIIEIAETQVLDDEALKNTIEEAEEKAISAEKTQEINTDNQEKEPVSTATESKNDTVKAQPEVVPANIAEAKTNDWQIQILSTKDKEAAEKTWKNMQEKYSYFKGLPYEIQTAEVADKGTYYRLKVGAFADKNAADAICAKFKAEKGSCIITKK